MVVSYNPDPDIPRFELADVFRLFGDEFINNHRLPLHHLKVIQDILNCRTSALGGHVDECDSCGALRISYNSCRNRHCPKCQSSSSLLWVEARKEDLLPIEYFHVVFTLPDMINSLARFNQALIYTGLFRAASETLLEFGHRHLGGELGITAVLHTWGQTLAQHIHLHCIVTGGALSVDGREWKSCSNGYLFPLKAMGVVFRAKFCDYLKEAFDKEEIVFPAEGSGLADSAEFERGLQKMKGKKWVVYTKRPFAGAEQVIAYIGRYTHRAAITNSRILNIAQGEVTFQYKDYRDGNRIKRMKLPAGEFIRRFLLHVLPEGFVRIRHYGLMANGRKKAKLEMCRELLGEGIWPTQRQERENQEQGEREKEEEICAECGKGNMVRKVELEAGAGPPETGRHKAVA